MGLRRHIGKIPGYDGVRLRYVLERKSNYARAAYRAVMHAIGAGVI